MGYLHPNASAWPVESEECHGTAAVLRERNRMAGELHEVIEQNFQYILLQLRAARGLMRAESAPAGRHVGIAEQRLCEIWEELRTCVHGLTPAALERGSLVSALSRHVAALSEVGPAAVAFEVCGTPYPLASVVETQLFRIAQEAVSNALRHSGGTRIAVEISFDADAVRLTVTDNGRGFRVEAASEGRGMCGMRDRASRAGGDVAIDSDVGRGTEVRATVPREGATDTLVCR